MQIKIVLSFNFEYNNYTFLLNLFCKSSIVIILPVILRNYFKSSHSSLSQVVHRDWYWITFLAILLIQDFEFRFLIIIKQVHGGVNEVIHHFHLFRKLIQIWPCVLTSWSFSVSFPLNYKPEGLLIFLTWSLHLLNQFPHFHLILYQASINSA